MPRSQLFAGNDGLDSAGEADRGRPLFAERDHRRRGGRVVESFISVITDSSAKVFQIPNVYLDRQSEIPILIFSLEKPTRHSQPREALK
jgi:hypothetical protein